MSKALIVEADRELMQAIDMALRSEGIKVVSVDNADEALRVIGKEHPDITILDPALFWLGSLRNHKRSHLSPSNTATAVVILIPKRDPTKIRPAENYSEDIPVIKLVDTSEVISHIKAIQRRDSSAVHSVVLRADVLEMDLERWSVSVEGRTIELTVKEFGLLRMLLKARGRVLTRDVLHEAVWEHDTASGVDSRTVDVHVGRLRKKLGPAGRYIMTVRGVGYRLSVLAEQLSRSDSKKDY